MDPLTIMAGMSAVGSIANGIFGNSAADDAAKQQKKALKYVKQQSKIARGDVAPYLNAGTTAMPSLLDALGLGNSDAAISQFQNSPLYKLLYQSSIDQGNKAMLATAGSRGQLNSGSTRTGIADNAQRTTRNFLTDYIGGLGDIATRGQNAANTSANIATGTGSQLAGLQSGMGDISLARGLGMGNAISGGMGDLASILGQRSAQGSSLYGGGSYNPGVGPGGMGFTYPGGPR